MTDLVERLALIVDAKTDGAVTSIKRLALSEQEAADKAELLQAKIADLNTRIARSASGPTATQTVQLKRLNSEYRGLTATLGNVPAAAGKVERALQKTGLANLVPAGALSAAGKALPGLAAGAAVFGGFEFLKSGIKDFEALAGQIRAVAQASGASVPDASKLVAVTNALGLNSDSLAQSMFRLGKQIDLQPQKLAAYGIAVAKTKTGNTDLYGTLQNVATAYQNTQDPARRAALVYQAFGRAGANMLPILNANRKQLKDIADEAAKQGLIFNSQDLTNARNLAVATQEMKDAFHGMAISASKTLVPALTEAARLTTSIVDFMNKPVIYDGSKKGKSVNDLGNASSLPGIINQVKSWFGGGGHKAGKSQAQTEVDQAQAAAAQAPLISAAQATLDESTIQASGIVAVTAAKQTLASTKTALAAARDAQARARRDLAALQAKGTGSGASADAIRAAEARVTEAEAKLRAAEYKGGDARIAGAQASVLSAQDRLNKLRSSGTSETNKLANAEDRLRAANEKVAAAQGKVVAAHKAVRAAGGQSSTSVLATLDKQITDKTTLANAQFKLAGEGASAATLAYLDKLNQKAPGTLVKLANTAGTALVHAINAKIDSLQSEEDFYTRIAGDPAAAAAAGATRGKLFATSFFNAFGLPKSGVRDFGGSPAPSTPKSGSRDFGGPKVTTNIGTMNVTTDDPQKVANTLAARARFKALGGGALAGGFR